MEFSNRYQAHYNLSEISLEGQEKISDFHVTVVGCGGLGCSNLLSLTAIGFGKITIIDDDVIELSNLQRQLLFEESDIGKYKCEVAKQKLIRLNSDVHITIFKERVVINNVNQFLNTSDVIIDCTDNFTARLILDQYSKANNIPLVFGGVKGFEGEVSVFNYLKGKSLSETFENKQEVFQNENCKDSGVIVPIVSIVASMQVMEVVKICLGLPNVLQGKMVFFNLLKNKFRIFNLK